MSWRQAPTGFTGSNNIPLGNRRRFRDDEGGDDGYSPSQPPSGIPTGEKRGRSPEPKSTASTGASLDAAVQGAKRRKKKSRWGPAEENKAAGLVGLPTLVTGPMTAEQLEAYAVHYRIQEITKKLQINDILPPEDDRSPSPPPIYDNFGRRVNTTEYRYRKKYEDERHHLVQQAFKIIPNYQPPPDYRRPTKTQEKVYVPVNDYPEINFIGLLIGPRGNTLKKMETESGAKIAIRGKGSVKEGKGRSDAAHTSNQEEDLHCLIMADSEDKVNKAKALIHNIIETAASIPEGQNELKRNQLRELAALNGTLRDDENQACANCGQIGHRKYDCPEQRNFTANIVCRVCGNMGHMARDCPERQRGQDWRAPRTAGRVPDQDKEYESLMNELSGGAPTGLIQAAPGADSQSGGDFKPWRQGGGSGGPAPWQQRNRDDHNGGSSGAAPWASRGRGGGNNYGGYEGGRDQGNYGGHSAAPWANQSSAAPWQQGAPPPPPPPSDGNQNPWAAYGYGQQPPGYGMPPAPVGVPGTMDSYYGSVPPLPPPPDSGDISPPPPPPPSEQPPPPPPPMD